MMGRDYLPGSVAIGWGITVLNWKRVDLDQKLGRNSLLWGLRDTGTGWPGKLWLHPPWQCSRPGWMGLWATWSSGRCPCPWQGAWNEMIFKVSSNPNHSMILWFCDNWIVGIHVTLEVAGQRKRNKTVATILKWHGSNILHTVLQEKGLFSPCFPPCFCIKISLPLSESF